MSNRSRQYRYYRRRRRRPALLGATAFVAVIALALGGLTLVGLDTVGPQGIQLSRAVQPEVAQVPEVTKEKSSSSNEQASNKKDSKKNERASGEESSKEHGAKKEDKKQDAKKKEKKEPKGPPPPQDPTTWMSIPRLGMYSDTVYNSGLPSTMDVGAIKLPSTGFPWQDNANTYISAHRIGYPGTESYDQFYALPAMQMNDVVYLTDANGTTYEYRVTDKFAVKPAESWVTEPQPGGDMVSLQTCVDSLDPNTWWDISPKLMRSGPDSARLVVQAEKVETYPPQGGY